MSTSTKEYEKILNNIQNNIHRLLKELFPERVGDKEITVETNFSDDFSLGSLDITDIFVATETSYAIKFTDIQTAQMKTGDIVSCVALHVAPTSLDINAVMKILPHRYPFLFIDNVPTIDLSINCLTAIKNVSVGEPYFQGHFPDHPVMPGVLGLEGAAQACGILANLINDTRNDKPFIKIVYRRLDGVVFKNEIIPGNQISYQVELIRQKRIIWEFSVNILVGDKVATEIKQLTIALFQ